jgi:4a-hydroxytetrahydrobiopterin dehydratase
MPYAPLLAEAEVEAALVERPAWHREGAELIRTIRCPTFRDAISLVDRVADVAEDADHHPDIDIRWRQVTFRLTTKAAGGLTDRDLKMVATIDALIPLGWPD